MNIDRRNFLRGGALAGGAAMLAAVGCTPTTQGDGKDGGSASNLPEGVTDAFVEDSMIEVDEITDFAKEETYDIVVIGAGTAGVPAILTALEEGATVACLQREDSAQANGNGSSGIILEESNPLGMKQYIQAWRKSGGYRMQSDLLQLFMDHSGETAMWILTRSDEEGFPSYNVSATANKYEGDKGTCTAVLKSYGPKPDNHGTLMRTLAQRAEKEGAVFYYGTPCVQLQKDDSGRVVAAIGKNSDGYIKLIANKAVIIAAGDYQNNENMVKALSPDVARFGRKQSGRTGDGILMAALAGGRICPVNHAKTMHDMDAQPMLLTRKPFMALDESGKRFMNEDIPMESWDLTLRERSLDVEDPGRFVRIFDNDYQAKYELPPSMGVKTLENYIPGFKEDPENVYPDLTDTYRADTLDELAEQLDIPVDALKKSVEDWNKMCETGEDLEFGLSSELMKPIDTPPYWGTRQWIRCSAINSGIGVNGNCQVVDENSEPIPGLYSVGSGAGSVSGGLEWNLAQGGLCCGIYMTMGRYAVIHALTGKMEPKNPMQYEECKHYWEKKGK